MLSCLIRLIVFFLITSVQKLTFVDCAPYSAFWPQIKYVFADQTIFDIYFVNILTI